MIDNCKNGNENLQPLPPQLFNNQEYCGVRRFNIRINNSTLYNFLCHL